jgi:hypothetical protein
MVAMIDGRLLSCLFSQGMAFDEGLDPHRNFFAAKR